jgi:hypothetical protein
MVYMRNGFKGVQMFRADRLMQGRYGKQRAFHDGTRLKEQVHEALAQVESETDSPAFSGLFELLKKMFAERSMDRPNTKEMKNRLERIALQALIQELLDAIAKLRKGTGTNVFQMALYLEDTRFRAWAGALRLIPLRQQSFNSIVQIPASFPELCEPLEGAIESMKSPLLFETSEHNESFVLSALRQCNDKIYDDLPKPLSKNANGLFQILFTETASSQSLLSISKATAKELPGYENTCRIAAIKHMSFLYLQNSEDVDGSSKIEQSLIEKDMLPDNFQARPDIYWYNAGYAQDQQQKVLVEWRGYGKNLDDEIAFEKVQKQVETMFRRIQGLVAMLRQPKSSNFRVLDCLGTFNDSENLKFGIVYDFPDKHSAPIRLHYLLKGGGAKGIRPPHIGQKFTLAKALAACLQDVHLSGWVHKDINSYNILFFRSASQLNEENYRTPFLIGFQYSREDEQGAYTSGPDSSDETRQYQHPCYRKGSTSFRREFDYYSLGLVLLEIGVWESLGNVYNRQPMSSPSVLRDEYIRICDRQILDRMGPIYSEVTRTCLQAESRLGGAEADAAIDFQRHVIDKLEICRV